MNIEYDIVGLDNGVNIMYIPNPNAKVTSFQVFCRVGSIYESKEIQGTSHYLEHMVFKGTDKRPTAKEISSELDSVGAYFNAYTDKNVTCYIVKVSSDNISKGMDIISDMLKNSKFRAEDFEKEKNIVVEEVNKGRDQPTNLIIEKLYEIVFEGHQLGHSVGGYEDIIRTYNLETVKAYFDKYYVPNNMTIAISTNIPKGEIIEQLGNYFSNYTKDDSFALPTIAPHQINTVPRYIFTKKDLQQVHLAIGFPTINMFHKDRYVLDIIKIILAGNMSSRLFLAMREDAGLSYTVYVSNAYYEDTGCCYIYTGFDKKALFCRNMDSLSSNSDTEKLSNDILPGGLPILLDNLYKLKTEAVSEKELSEARGYLKGHLMLETEDSLGLSDYFGKQLLFKGNTQHDIENFDDILGKYNQVSSADIMAVSEKYFNKSSINISIIGECNEADVRKFIELYKF